MAPDEYWGDDTADLQSEAEAELTEAGIRERSDDSVRSYLWTYGDAVDARVAISPAVERSHLARSGRANRPPELPPPLEEAAHRVRGLGPRLVVCGVGRHEQALKLS